MVRRVEALDIEGDDPALGGSQTNYYEAGRSSFGTALGRPGISIFSPGGLMLLEDLGFHLAAFHVLPIILDLFVILAG